MQQNFQDAMAIVSRYGKPDLFVTFTCNPKCTDIQEALPATQHAHDRPDIVSRVFKLHMKELMLDITERHVLGVPVAHVYVIEFQKRGLPHCHLLIILDKDSKLREATDIDTIISAEIPDPATDPVLYDIVRKTMVHGPCGVLNSKSVCMSEGKCTKDYPKDFREETSFAQDGYPHYRRRDNGRTARTGYNDQYEVDNRWIVPYNPYLLCKYGAHINVEACTSIRSVKYLFKYVYKGHDCANIELTQTNELTHDEVTTFLDARYVSAPESFWRLSEFNMHHQSHTIVRLPVHLPRQQPVYFQAGQHEAAVQQAANQETQLTAYFKLSENEQIPYCYHEIPLHYVFKPQQKKWQNRKRGGQNIIARLYAVSPKNMERYCLRLLLLHVPGAQSFEQLRTVDNITADTFQEACLLMHLLTDDTEWDHALQEASVFQMPSQLRGLFATICLQCEPSDPLQLWVTHKEAMIEDFLHSNSTEIEAAENRALRHLQAIFQQNGMSCDTFGLPAIQEDVQLLEQDFDMHAAQQQAQDQIPLLNEEQRSLFEAVQQSMALTEDQQPDRCHAYFLDGPGGSGKTMLYNTIISFFRGQGKKVASSAWTGIAATLLAGGRTVHNLFKLPVPILETSVCHVSPTSVHASYLRSVSLFIIDEASMIPVHALSAIDKMLRDITNNDVPFGGKIFLLVVIFAKSCLLFHVDQEL